MRKLEDNGKFIGLDDVLLFVIVPILHHESILFLNDN